MKGCLLVAFYIWCGSFVLGGLLGIPLALAHGSWGALLIDLIGVGIFSIPFILLWRGHQRATTAAALAFQAKGERAVLNEQILTRVNTLESLPLIQPNGLALAQDEVCYFQRACNAMTPVTREVQQGGYRDVSIPIGRTGLAFNTGSFHATPIPVTSYESAGNGTIYLTNRRIVFVGPHQSVSIPVESVLNVSLFDDGMQIDAENRSPWIFQTGDVELAALTYRAVHG